MAVDMLLKLDRVDDRSKDKKQIIEIDLLGRCNGTGYVSQGPSSVPVGEGQSRAFRRVPMFALEVAVGAAACAGAILAIFAWTAASL